MSYTLTYGQGGLADAAKYLSSKGRGEDTQLIHMTPGEIDALQALAEQHGGSLTINPHTGLPEAGWLGNILKVAAPMALSFIPGVGPLAASIGGAFGATGALASGIGMGLLTGGVTTLATGSLKQGLGAGVMGGIMGGLSAPSTAAAQTSNIATATGADAASKAAALQAQNTAVNTGLNQAGTSMMTNPSILNAATAPVAQTVSNPLSGVSDWWGGLSGPKQLGYGMAGVAGLGILGDALAPKFKTPPIDKGSIRPYTYASTIASPSPYPTGPMYNAAGNPILSNKEQRYFNQGYTELPAYKAAEGGLMAAGGVSTFPQSQQNTNQYATPLQAPMGTEVVDAGYEQKVNQYTGEPIGYAAGGSAEPENLNQYSYNPLTQQYAQVKPLIKDDVESSPVNSHPFFMNGFNRQDNNQNIGNQGIGGIGFMGNFMRKAVDETPKMPSYTYNPDTQQYTQMANGGMANLGDYSDGGRLLRGPGDGVSDSIPASIGGKQPARLADGEFVIPARIVSELGNGSTDAGAKRLYAMMDKIQAGRKKTVGKGKVAVDSKAAKHLPR
jgi:hypothetical protein